MKKLLCILLAAVLTVSLWACNNQADTGDDTPTTPPIEGPDFSLGETTDTAYYNTVFGLICTLSEDWSFITLQELREWNGIVGELTYEEMHKTLKKAELVNLTEATRKDGLAGISVSMEKRGLTEIDSLNLKEYIESSIPVVEDQFEAGGYTDTLIEPTTLRVSGVEYDVMMITSRYSNIPIYVARLCYKTGRYVVVVSVWSMLSNEIPQLLEHIVII